MSKNREKTVKNVQKFSNMSKNREKTVENVKKPGKNRQKCRKTWKKT